jgi:hypothetical protein
MGMLAAPPGVEAQPCSCATLAFDLVDVRCPAHETYNNLSIKAYFIYYHMRNIVPAVDKECCLSPPRLGNTSTVR